MGLNNHKTEGKMGRGGNRANSKKLKENVNDKKKDALAGVAQWTEHRPVNQTLTGSISCQGTGLGCRPGPQ